MIQTPGGFGQLGVIQLDFGLCQMTYLTAKSTLEEKKRPAYVDSLITTLITSANRNLQIQLSPPHLTMLARLSSMEVLGAPAVLVFEFSVSE